MAMNESMPGGQMPGALTREKPAANLAALVMNSSLDRLTVDLISQWQKRDRFDDVRKHGIRPLDRALFYGPPGNGKTMSAQLVAAKLGCPLYRVRCESLITANFGGVQKNMSDVMDWLARQPLAVVLWDECESLFPNRGKSNADACTTALINTMQIFWQRLDRWESPQVFLLATNLIERLDSALLSRIELQIEFGPPTREQCSKVIDYWSEIFHQYDPEVWGSALVKRINNGELPESFRELWQVISCSVRDVIVSRS